MGVLVVDMLSAEDEREIRTSLRKVMAPYTDEYWMRHDMDHEFAWDFHDGMAEAGWLGICIPGEDGGGGPGVPGAAPVSGRRPRCARRSPAAAARSMPAPPCRWACSGSSPSSSTGARSRSSAS